MRFLPGLHHGLEIAQSVALESPELWFRNRSGETYPAHDDHYEDCQCKVEEAVNAVNRLDVKPTPLDIASRSTHQSPQGTF